MALNHSRIRGFLLVKPKPSTVRVTIDDAQQEVKLGSSYAKTAETIEALEPDLVECLDGVGTVLRALRADSPEARRSDAAAIPAGLEADPHALMLVHFSNQIHRAYEHATEIAFSKMVEVFDIMSARSESIEQRLERTEARNRRLEQDSVDDAIERAEESAAGAGNPFEHAMASAFMSGVASTGSTPPAKPHTNGKASASSNGKQKASA